MVMVFAGVALVIVSVSMLFLKEIRLLERKTGGEERCWEDFCVIPCNYN